MQLSNRNISLSLRPFLKQYLLSIILCNIVFPIQTPIQSLSSSPTPNNNIMAPKAPSEGQKVDLGQNAPVKEEGPGKVAPESLAAESAKEGGGFASNEGIRSENQASSGSENTSVGRTTKTSSVHSANTSSAPSSNSNSNSNSAQSGSAKSNGGTAPSYVENQYIKASGGPHGKNITEGFDDSKTEDGLKKALNSEPGSEDDPSRVAELQFQQSQTAAGRDAGPKQTGLANESSFDALNNETSS
jgi:hypothetical protein